MKRQVNPRSLDNLLAGKNKSARQRKQVKLMPETIELFERLGGGSLSDGIDKLAALLLNECKVMDLALGAGLLDQAVLEATQEES